MKASEALDAALKHHQAGRFEEAERIYKKILQGDPMNPDALHLLGLSLHQRGNHREALEYINRAVSSAPESSVLITNLAAVYQKVGDLEKAVACCRHAIAITPSDYRAHYNLGCAFQAKGNLDEAVASYRRAIAINPHFAEAHCGLGTVFGQQGKFDQAVDSCNRALELNPHCTEAVTALVKYQPKSNWDDATVQRLEALLDAQRLSHDQKRRLHFALGKIYDDCEKWGEAFAHYQHGNSLTRVSFDGQRIVERVDSAIKTFRRSLLDKGASLGRWSELPVLIVGMPRSGTSLVEQILASHPAVFGAGELPDIGKLAAQISRRLNSNLSYPACLSELDKTTAEDLADRYLEHLRRLSTNAVRVTDKMPANFMHLGLIALLLPAARIVHCRRHPLDLCLSCFFHDFTNLNAHSYSFDLDSLGLYYQQYARLMEHWRQVLPLRLLEVDYEELVAAPEKVSRQLIDFCALEWEPACLSFHTTERVVQTESQWQVRQPIYGRSVERWRHYSQHLGPLKDALEWSS